MLDFPAHARPSLAQSQYRIRNPKRPSLLQNYPAQGDDDDEDVGAYGCGATTSHQVANGARHHASKDTTRTLLALEILASSFVGWGSLFPDAAQKARALLRRNAISSQTPLMDFYVYPPKDINSQAIATLTPQMP
jgi:hypothetical protein